MGFFATFRQWLDGQLLAYIGDNTARLASVLEPAVVAVSVTYVMTWGYLHLTGKIQEPVLTGLKRIAVLALVLGASLRLWLYNELIVDTFYQAPAQLAAAVIGTNDPVATIDVIWDRGGLVAGNLWDKGGVMNGDFGYYIAGAMVWCLMGVLCVYAMFLFALSSIALAVLLALGPLFIVSLLFESTKRFFTAWIAQLANYGLITVLTVMIAALLLQIVQSYAAQTADRGAAIVTVDALHMMLVATLVFLVLRQVMPIAAGLAGGVALSSYGLVSRTLHRSLQTGRAAAGPAVAYGAVRALQAGRLAGDALRGTTQAVRQAATRGQDWRRNRR